MNIVRTPAALHTALAALPPATTVGLVPTMGSLHAGHEALVAASLATTAHTVVSIFVNPAQFGPSEDFQTYPANEARDVAVLRAAGVNTLFIPSVPAVYPPGYSTFVTTGPGDASVNTASEAARRPHMFRGVATVVTKLLVLVRPHSVFFGRKDAQQCAVVRRLVEDLWIGAGTQVVCVDTVREHDGLAMSSRNVYLGERERAEAPVLHRALSEARRVVREGGRDAEAVRRVMVTVVDEWREGGGKDVDFEMGYVSVCCGTDFKEVDGVIPEGTEILGCIAAGPCSCTSRGF